VSKLKGGPGGHHLGEVETKGKVTTAGDTKIIVLVCRTRKRRKEGRSVVGKLHVIGGTDREGNRVFSTRTVRKNYGKGTSLAADRHPEQVPIFQGKGKKAYREKERVPTSSDRKGGEQT